MAARGTFLAALLAAPLLMGAGAADDGRFYAGAYSFSDEEGGFRITGVTGTGTREDPFVIGEDLPSASPVTLTVRAARPVQPLSGESIYANGILYIHFVVRNGSGLPWVAFEFELQVDRGQPSVFSDGLSFDQRQEAPDAISCDRFSEYKREFEPYDRLLFRQGAVDPGAMATFGFLVTDFSPHTVFYILQDPRIPSS